MDNFRFFHWNAEKQCIDSVISDFQYWMKVYNINLLHKINNSIEYKCIWSETNMTIPWLLENVDPTW